MRKAAFVYIILTCTLFSCIKPPSYSVIPHIEYVSVSSPIALAGYSDTITFSFTDGDGDIGIASGSTADSSDSICCGIRHGDSSCLQSPAFNVFLIDSRDSCINTFASANVQPSGKYKGISGTIQVIIGVSNTKCFGVYGCPCPVNDTVTYAIILKDMAGHLSNTAHTIPIAIACPQ